MATSKGHMKRPRKGIRSTTPKQPRIRVPASVPDPGMPGLIKPHDPHADDDFSPTAQQYHHIIDNDDDQSIANVFCFGAFADKISGVLYNDCTGEFPYMRRGQKILPHMRFYNVYTSTMAHSRSAQEMICRKE